MPPLVAGGAAGGIAKDILSPQGPVRVGNITGGILMGLAGLFDGLQIFFFAMMSTGIGIPLAFFVPPFITLVAGIVLGVCFALLQVKFFTGKYATARLFSVIGPLVIEVIPLLSELPLIAPATAATIAFSRLEDAETNREQETRRKDAQEIERRRRNERSAPIVLRRASSPEEAAPAETEEKPRPTPEILRPPKMAGAEGEVRDFR